MQESAARNSVPSRDQSQDNFIMMSDFTRDQYPDNTAVDFTNNLTHTFLGGESCELEVTNMFTNWRVSPHVLTEENNPVNVKIIAIPGCLFCSDKTLIIPSGTVNLPNYQYNPYKNGIKVEDLSFGTGNVLGFNKELNQYVTDMGNTSVEGTINFPKGTVLDSQIGAWEFLSAGINQLWTQYGTSLVENFIKGTNFEYFGTFSDPWVYPGVYPPPLNLANISNAGSTKVRNIYIFDQPDIDEIPLGALTAQANGKFGILSMLTMGKGMLDCSINSNRNATPQAPLNIAVFSCHLIVVIIDTLSFFPFKNIYSTDPALGLRYPSQPPPYVLTDPDVVRMSRLLGLPNDLLIPYGFVQFLLNASLYTVDLVAFFNQITSPIIGPPYIGNYPQGEGNAAKWSESAWVFLNYVFVNAPSSGPSDYWALKFYYNSMPILEKAAPVVPVATLYSKLPNVFYFNMPTNNTFNTSAPFMRKISGGTQDEVPPWYLAILSLVQNYISYDPLTGEKLPPIDEYPTVPGIKMIQTPNNNSEFSGKLLPNGIVIPYNEYYFPNGGYYCRPPQFNDGNFNDMYRLRGLYPAEFYDNQSALNEAAYQQILCQYISDWNLDNDRLYIMGEDGPTIGKNSVGGTSISCLGIIPTLSQNAFGVYQQTSYPMPEVIQPTRTFYNQESAEVPPRDTNWSALAQWPNVVDKVMDFGDVIFPSKPVNAYSLSSFMPLGWNAQAQQQVMAIAYKPENPQKMSSMRIYLLNEAGESPPVYSFSNKLPFTSFSVQLKRYGYSETAVEEQYFQSGIPFYKIKPKYSSRVQMKYSSRR